MAARHRGIWTAGFAFLLVMLPQSLAGITGVRKRGEPVSDWLLMNSLLMLPAAYAALIVHQAVRATAAHFLGIRSVIHIGSGRSHKPFNIGSAKVTLSWFPSWASVLAATTEPRSLRLRTWLACMSGTLSMIAVGGVALHVNGWSLYAVAENLTVGPAISALILLAAVFVILATHDIYHLFTIPLTPVSQLSPMLMWGHLFVAMERAERQDHIGAADACRQALEYRPDDPVAQSLNVAARQQLGDPALDLARALVEKPMPLPSLRRDALGLWAWGCYLSKDPELLAAADEASSQALFLATNAPGLLTSEAGSLDTRGHVLLWAGRYEEAAEALTRSSSLATNAGTRCASACGLAMVHAACGRISEAETWLVKAKEQMPTYHLIADAEARVVAARTTGLT